MDDCGGIYTYNKDEPAGWTNIIRGNTVTNSMGNPSGRTGGNYLHGNGIYLDQGSHGFSVLNNTVSNADVGIHINNGYDNTISGNSIYGARAKGLDIYETDFGGTAASGAGTVHNNTISNNTFESVTDIAYLQKAADGVIGVIEYYSQFESITSNFGHSDNNQYCHPLNTQLYDWHGGS